MDEKHLVKLLWVVKACLLAMLAYVGFEVVTSRLHLGTVFDPGKACGEQLATGTRGALPGTRSPPDYATIVQRDLFTGTDNAVDAQVGSDPSQTADSMASTEEMGLRLVGAIAGGPVASRAIIQNTKSKATGVYRIGDTIVSPAYDGAAGATVEAIHRDAVILRYKGRSLVLKLHTATVTDNKSDRGKAKPPDTKDATATNARTTPLLDRAEYVAEIFRKAKIEPYVKDGQTEGLRITGLEKIPMAEMIGLKNGDILQAVNGQRLTSQQKAFQILMKAKTLSKVDIQLSRDGKSKDLSFNL
jgi:general secretion pathway protein C